MTELERLWKDFEDYKDSIIGERTQEQTNELHRLHKLYIEERFKDEPPYRRKSMRNYSDKETPERMYLNNQL